MRLCEVSFSTLEGLTGGTHVNGDVGSNRTGLQVYVHSETEKKHSIESMFCSSK